MLFWLLGFFLVQASQTDTLVVKSACLNKSISSMVIIPDSYKEGDSSFPVLYLLHGAGGDFKNWLQRVPALRNYADMYHMIIVCPDGGTTSWYFDSPIDPTYQYETYVSKELVSSVDNHYRTIPSSKGRAITGLSMGGHGAFYLAFKHNDIWGAAGSMSGGVDIRPFPESWDISKRLGKDASNSSVWESHSVINLVYLLNGKNLKLTFDCGVDDFFIDVNRSLHEKLLYMNIPHDYTERPGRHNWDYWSNSIKYQLVFFNNFFTKAQ